MQLRAAGALALIAAVALSAVPAQAAAKKKPKPIRGSYTLSLTPDPSQDVTGQVPGSEAQGCAKALPGSFDRRDLTLPAAGTLEVVLDSPDPTGAPELGPLGAVGTDWDLWIYSGGSIADASHGATSHESTKTRFTKKGKVTLEVCNLVGTTKGSVSYVFTYA